MSEHQPEKTELLVRLLIRHQEDLFRYIFSLLPHQEDARDALQETSVALYRKFADYDPAKPFLAWAYGFAYLEVLKQRERCVRGGRHLREDLVALLARASGVTGMAGAWEAFRRGYRMGLMASTDNHVGMPGRSYPGDRQIHTPFPGGLCAVWADELTADSVFAALRARRCYGTTGARIIVRFSIGSAAMGGTVKAGQGMTGGVQVVGTEQLDRVELVRDCRLWRTLPCAGERLETSVEFPAEAGVYYLRIFQKDGQRAWSSPIWME